MKNYLLETDILDFSDASIQRLISNRDWQNLNDFEKIGAAYLFVKDEIKFGYNRSDAISASEVLVDGYGQCNTKGNLLIALLRALEIPCRFHGFTIERSLQKGAIPSYLFWLAPKYIIHSWVEVYFENKWINLEGFILDERFLTSVQQMFSGAKAFSGYGVATSCLSKPEVQWDGNDTYIQKEGIHDDFGIFDSPDDFYASQGTNLSGMRRLAYQYIFRHLINLNVQKVRNWYNSCSPNTDLKLNPADIGNASRAIPLGSPKRSTDT